MRSKIAVLAGAWALAVSAEVCTWQGGTSGNWSEAANWTPAKPATGDTVRIAPDGAALDINNDIEGLEIEKLWLLGDTGKVTLRGNEITITGTAGAFSNVCQVLHYAPLRFTHDAVASFRGTSGDSRFYKPLYLDGAITFTVEGYTTCHVYLESGAKIIGPEATWVHKLSDGSLGKAVYFRDTVDLKKFTYSMGVMMNVLDRTAIFNVREPIEMEYGSFRTDAKNAFVTPPVLTYKGYREGGRGIYNFQSHNQVIDRISDPYNANAVDRNADRMQCTAMTLTMKGTADATSYNSLYSGALSIVWDPVGNCTQTFRDRAHGTTGSLTVKGGTLACAGTNTFAKASAVYVRGGTFDLSTTSSGALASVTTLGVWKNGHFQIGAQTPNPFTDDTLTLYVQTGATFDWPAGLELRVKGARVNGHALAAGDYSGTAHAEAAGLNRVNWINGAGILHVAATTYAENEWISASDTAWNTAANWSTGVPDSTLEAFVRAGLPEIATVIAPFKGLTVGGLVTANPTLTITHDTDLRNTTVALEEGGTLCLAGGTTVSAGLTFSSDGKMVVTNDAVWRLDGASVCPTKLDFYDTSRMEVTNRHELTSLSTGETVFHERSLFSVSKSNGNRVRWTPAKDGETCHVSFQDASGITNVPSAIDSIYFCDRVAGKTIVDVDTTGLLQLGGRLSLPVGAGYAELNVKQGDVYSGAYGTMLASGTGYTGKTTEGILKITGGLFYLYTTANPNKAAFGFVIGDGSNGTMSDGLHTGLVEISGGVISNVFRSALIVGIGHASGTFRQTGGRVCHYANTDARHIVIGMQGATGRWEMLGGTAHSKTDVWVGGCETNCISWTPESAAMKNWACPTGTLSIAGGTFTVDKTVHVAAKGKGTLAMSGTGALVAAGLDLAKTQDGDVTHGAELSFTVGAASAPSVAVSGTCSVDPAATLAVDATAFTGKQSVTLLQAASIAGDFASVTLTCPRYDVRLVKTDRVIKLRVVNGTTILIR